MDAVHQHILSGLPKDIKTWHDKIEYMYAQQRETWKMMRNHYHQFEQVQRRDIDFGGFKITVQFNAGRVRSTCADLSKQCIENRRCFLCAANLPAEQKGFTLLDKYLLLVNPFPIFERHLTISDFSHIPQKIENRIVDMLSIAQALNGFTVFYNGPKCGASAPDHFHFQAVKKGEMPIDNDTSTLKTTNAQVVFESDNIKISQINNYFRNAILLESDYREPIDYFFHKIYMLLTKDAEAGEPLMNVIARFDAGKFSLIIFPRAAQRPSCYFEEGENRIIISPASVELGGVCVVPRQEDFEKITIDDLVKIYKEVMISDTDFAAFIDKLKADS